jgi:hypothetical protein
MNWEIRQDTWLRGIGGNFMLPVKVMANGGHISRT